MKRRCIHFETIANRLCKAGRDTWTFIGPPGTLRRAAKMAELPCTKETGCETALVCIDFEAPAVREVGLERTAMSCEYVRTHYGVPACVGRRIVHRGNPGIIAEDRGHYIGVNFDSDKPGVVENVHPTDDVEYGDMGKVRTLTLTRSQRRYREYLDSPYYDAGDSFAVFLGVE